MFVPGDHHDSRLLRHPLPGAAAGRGVGEAEDQVIHWLESYSWILVSHVMSSKACIHTVCDALDGFN